MDINDPVIKTLLKENNEFRSLFKEHEELEKKITEIDSYHYLTPQQEMERKNIQKIKLKGRDRMEEIRINAIRSSGKS